MPILRIFDPSLALVVGRVEPATPDQEHEHVAGGERLVDRLLPGPAGLDVVDVPEHRVGSEVLGQAIVDAPGEALTVVAPVGDEDADARDPARSALMGSQAVSLLRCWTGTRSRRFNPISIAS